jgi:hypothetical protein
MRSNALRNRSWHRVPTTKPPHQQPQPQPYEERYLSDNTNKPAPRSLARQQDTDNLLRTQRATFLSETVIEGKMNKR